MKLSAVGVGVVAAAALAAAASAQDFTAQYEAQDETRVGLRWSVPFTNRRDAARSAKTVSLSLDHRLSGVDVRSLSVASYSFGEGPHTIFGEADAAYAAGDDEPGLFSTTRGRVLLGVGAALAVWAIVEAADDDDEGDIVCITEPCN
jgi:hypothetical protein